MNEWQRIQRPYRSHVSSGSFSSSSKRGRRRMAAGGSAGGGSGGYSRVSIFLQFFTVLILTSALICWGRSPARRRSGPALGGHTEKARRPDTDMVMAVVMGAAVT